MLKLVRQPRFDVRERPFVVIWEITRACDLACAHCRASAIAARNPAELTLAEGRALIDQVAAFEPPRPLFVLTGGDPMKRPDLMELVAYGTQQGLAVALSPSATPLLTPEAIVALRSMGLKAISLSLDAATPERHDAFRGVSGVFERTLKVWDTARECGLKVQINTTVTRFTVEDLPAIARMARERQVLLWSVFFLVNVGRGERLEPITAPQCEDVMNFLCDAGAAIAVKTTEAPHFRRLVIERALLARRGLDVASLSPGDLYGRLKTGLGPWPSSPRLRRAPADVNAGSGFIFISHTGAVHPSGFFPLTVGSVRTRPLAEIYRRSPLLRALRDPQALGGRCGRCEFRLVCGGSRSRAFALSADPVGEDPLCAYEPGSFPLAEEVAEALAAESVSI